MLKRHTCEKCGYKWVPRIDKRPAQCPNCKNPKWDKPKQEKGK